MIADPGSVMDVSGGGGIFAYQFEAGIQGSVDTLQLQNSYVQQGQIVSQNVVYDSGIDSYRTGTPAQGMFRYVIVPSNEYCVPAWQAIQAGLQPGEEVTLSGAPGLKAGTYTLLPEQYAFLPGAMIVTDTGTKVTTGWRASSGDGYPIVAGYVTYAGTQIQPSIMDAIEVEPARAALSQGYFNKESPIAGNAGSLSISGSTTILNGEIEGAALSGYLGGTISLSGAEIFVLAPGQTQTGDSDALYIGSSVLSGKGYQEIDLGDSGTSTIELDAGASLNAAKVVLSANIAITLDKGAQITAEGPKGNGEADFITPNGILTLGQNSVVHASSDVTMTLLKLDYQAGPNGLKIDQGALNLTGKNVYFEPGDSQGGADPSGLYLGSSFWNTFRNFDSVNIYASGGASDGSTQGLVQFLGGTASAPSNIDLAAKNSFSISAKAIEGTLNASDGDVTITAPNISLLDRGGWPKNLTPAPALPDENSFILNASNRILIGEGLWINGSAFGSANPSGGDLFLNYLLVDGFKSIKFNAQNGDVSFIGNGSLITSADLVFSSGRIITSSLIYEVPDSGPTNLQVSTPYTAADFTVNTTGAVNIVSGGTAQNTAIIPGGSLEIDAQAITVTGTIQMSAGTLTLNGASGVTLGAGAQILDRGIAGEVELTPQSTQYSCSPGGSVYLSSANGAVDIEPGAAVNVSGAVEDNSSYGKGKNVFSDPNDIGVNAGLVSIYSPNAAAILEGTIVGAAGYWKSYKGKPVDGISFRQGEGGSFILDADGVIDKKQGYSDLSALLAELTSAGAAGGAPAGFTESVAIEVRGQQNPGDLVIGKSDAIYASNVSLTAGNGSIDFSGTIDSTGLGSGGTIQFNSGGSLTLEAGSRITSPGATVFLNTADSTRPTGAA